MDRNEDRLLRVGLIGFGAIGSGFAEAAIKGEVGQCELIAVLEQEGYTQAAANAVPPTCLVTTSLGELMSRKPDLVVEAASQHAVRAYAAQVLAAGVDLMVTSVGAMADEALYEELMALARAHRSRILIPTGAVAGLDGVAAAAVGRIDHLVHITRKPPRAWKGTLAEQQVDLERLEAPVVLYEGAPRESARLYPANVNVQTAVALAGAGFDQTRVKVVADPTITQNIHEIFLSGEFGEMQVTLRNAPTPNNPKTSRLAVLALIKAVRNQTATLVVGA